MISDDMSILDNQARGQESLEVTVRNQVKDMEKGLRKETQKNKPQGHIFQYRTTLRMFR